MNGTPIKDLKELFQISQSSIKRIIKSCKPECLEGNDETKMKNRSINIAWISRVITLFVEKAREPLFWKDIKEYLSQTYGVCLDTNKIRRILKRQGFSFKRSSSRPLLIDYNALKLKKILFSIKVWRIINSSTVFINIDESIITKSTRANYSWGCKGLPLNLSSLSIRGSIGLITAIMSNGISVTGAKKGTIKSSSFIEFIKHLLTIWNRL